MIGSDLLGAHVSAGPKTQSRSRQAVEELWSRQVKKRGKIRIPISYRPSDRKGELLGGKKCDTGKATPESTGLALVAFTPLKVLRPNAPPECGANDEP